MNENLKKKACEKAHQLAKNKGADYCTLGEWVVSQVLEEFARTGENVITLPFEVSGLEDPGKPLPCDQELELALHAREQAAQEDQCIEIRVRGKTVTVC